MGLTEPTKEEPVEVLDDVVAADDEDNDSKASNFAPMKLVDTAIDPNQTVFRNASHSLSLCFQLAGKFQKFMAIKRVLVSAVRGLALSGSSASSTTFTRHLYASAGSKKIVGVFYKAKEYADLNPNFLGCEEKALGIRDWLECFLDIIRAVDMGSCLSADGSTAAYGSVPSSDNKRRRMRVAAISSPSSTTPSADNMEMWLHRVHDRMFLNESSDCVLLWWAMWVNSSWRKQFKLC